MPVTIYDVAKLAHVSVTTISKILNHKDYDISDETRKRVVAVIKEVKFTPSGLARSLVTKKTNVLGLLLPDISNQYFADMARGVEDAANGLGYNIILCDTDEDRTKELEYLRILQEKGIDGVILVPAAESEKPCVEEAGYEKPYVLLERIASGVGTDIFQVRADNVKGGLLAARYLIGKGHRRIGLITGSRRSRESNDRVAGFHAAMGEAGLELDESCIYEGNYRFETGFLGAQYLVDRGVTAIFCLNDIMAAGAYRAISDRGLKIPRDVSLVGFDCVPAGELLEPPLTTIMQPNVEMGKVAAAMLVHRIKREPQESAVVFEPAFVERQSVRAL